MTRKNVSFDCSYNVQEP